MVSGIWAIRSRSRHLAAAEAEVDLVQQDATASASTRPTRSIHEPSCCSIAKFWRGSGRLPAKSRTAIRRFMLCLAWPVMCWLPRGGICRERGYGPILLFSLTAGVIYQFVADPLGTLGGALLAVGSWILQPNLFGHGHYAAYDAVLTSLWVLAIVVFTRAVAPRTEPEARSDPLGLDVGLRSDCRLRLATKLTGWFLPLPFLVWAGLYRSRQGFKTLFFGLLVAFAALYALMPPWWTEPVDWARSIFCNRI